MQVDTRLESCTKALFSTHRVVTEIYLILGCFLNWRSKLHKEVYTLLLSLDQLSWRELNLQIFDKPGHKKTLAKRMHIIFRLASFIFHMQLHGVVYDLL